MAGNVTIKVDPRRLKRAVAKTLNPRFREVGNEMQRQVRVSINQMNATPGGGGLGKPGTLAKAVVVRKRGVGVRVGAKSGTEAAAVLKRLTAGFAGTDRLGRVYTQPGRPLFGPILSRMRGSIVRKIGG